MIRPLSRWTAPVAALAGYAVSVGLLIATAWLVTRNGLSSGTLAGPDVALAATAPAVGAVLVARRPGNRTGQLLMLGGVSAAVQVFSRQYAWYAIHVRPGGPGGAWLLWVSDWVWVGSFGSIALFLVLLFPTGRVPSPRWRLLAWCNVAIFALLLLVTALHPGHLADSPAEPLNPVGIALLGRATVFVTALFLLALTSMLLCVARLFVRMREAGAVERAQVKWFTFAASVAVITTFLDGLVDQPAFGALDVLSALSFGALPIAIGIAILRYRLYDIDRLISRTVSYAILTGLLVAVYAGLVTVATRLVHSEDSLVIAGSTLAVAALFQPLRSRVQHAVDRRFNRTKYDAERTIEAFSRRLRGEADLETVRTDLLSVIGTTMQPAAAGLWLRQP